MKTYRDTQPEAFTLYRIKINNKAKPTNKKIIMNFKKHLGWIIAGAVVLLLVVWCVTGYNGLVSMDEKVSNNWQTWRHSISVAPTSYRTL